MVYYLIILKVISCSNFKMENPYMTPKEKAGAHLQQLLSKLEFPGIQYLIMNNQGVVFEFNGGWQDTASRTPVTAETTFMSASATKVITALAVLHLVDQGQVSLNEPLSKYFQAHPYGNDLTVRQLITHTAGVPNPMPLDWFHMPEKHDEYNESDELDHRLKKNPKDRKSVV